METQFLPLSVVPVEQVGIAELTHALPSRIIPEGHLGRLFGTHDALLKTVPSGQVGVSSVTYTRRLGMVPRGHLEWLPNSRYFGHQT